MHWLTSEDTDVLSVLWPDSSGIMNDDVLNIYLAAAKAACIAYAPALPAGQTEIPGEWVLAQAMQARNIYNAGHASPSGGFGDPEYGLTSFPLDWQVKQLLRPQMGVGAIV
jgi:hypothetical protein